MPLCDEKAVVAWLNGQLPLPNLPCQHHVMSSGFPILLGCVSELGEIFRCPMSIFHAVLAWHIRVVQYIFFLFPNSSRLKTQWTIFGWLECVERIPRGTHPTVNFFFANFNLSRLQFRTPIKITEYSTCHNDFTRRQACLHSTIYILITEVRLECSQSSDGIFNDRNLKKILWGKVYPEKIFKVWTVECKNERLWLNYRDSLQLDGRESASFHTSHGRVCNNSSRYARYRSY